MNVTPIIRTVPVVEIFGPVVQGEGPVAGQVTHFIRLGLCDFRCLWCDSMFAVDPRQVQQNATRMSVDTILDRLSELDGAPWVTLSGGNPVIHELADLTQEIQVTVGSNVCVETQGSKWRDWLLGVDMLVVSPKPPSSGMATEPHRRELNHFMAKAEAIDNRQRAIKIVVFDEADLVWAEKIMIDWPWRKKYLSVGTDIPRVGETLAETRQKVCDRYRWLSEQAPKLAPEVTVLPQLHVLAYGHQRGV